MFNTIPNKNLQPNQPDDANAIIPVPVQPIYFFYIFAKALWLFLNRQVLMLFVFSCNAMMMMKHGSIDIVTYYRLQYKHFLFTFD